MAERLLDVKNLKTYFFTDEGVVRAVASARSGEPLAKRTMKDGRPASKDPVLRQKIANLQVAERCLQLNGYRSLTRILQGAHPGPEGSIAKMAFADLNKDIYAKVMDLLGAEGMLYGSYEMVRPETAIMFETMQKLAAAS